MIEPLRIIYAGTPDFAVPTLQALIDSEHEVVAVYTQPDRPAGRGRKIQFGPVKQVAVDAGIPVEQAESLKTDEALQQLAAYNADVMVVAAYGLILPKAILETPKYGCFNIHGSLLPKWRGAAPIHRAIQSGDAETGITIMQMDVGLDTGDMLLKSRLPITDTDTYGTLHDVLAEQGAKDLLSVLTQLQEGKLNPEKQDESIASYAHKITKAEAEIDWTQSAKQIDFTIRGFNPFPAAFTLYHGKPMKLHMSSYSSETSDRVPGTVIDESKAGISVATVDGVLILQRLQMPGKKAMDVKDFLNGHSLSSVVLGQ